MSLEASLGILKLVSVLSILIIILYGFILAIYDLMSAIPLFCAVGILCLSLYGSRYCRNELKKKEI